MRPPLDTAAGYGSPTFLMQAKAPTGISRRQCCRTFAPIAGCIMRVWIAPFSEHVICHFVASLLLLREQTADALAIQPLRACTRFSGTSILRVSPPMRLTQMGRTQERR
jgi:hypothetical protein